MAIALPVADHSTSASSAARGGGVGRIDVAALPADHGDGQIAESILGGGAETPSSASVSCLGCLLAVASRARAVGIRSAPSSLVTVTTAGSALDIIWVPSERTRSTCTVRPYTVTCRASVRHGIPKASASNNGTTPWSQSGCLPPAQHEVGSTQSTDGGG